MLPNEHAISIWSKCVDEEQYILYSEVENISFEKESILYGNLFGFLQGCTHLKSVDFSNLEIRHTDSLSEMFSCCYELESVDLSGIDMSEVVDTFLKDGWVKESDGWHYYVEGELYNGPTMLAKGKPNTSFTGKIAYCPETDNWYYCTKGKIDYSFSGKVAPCTNGSMYYVTKGRIDRSFTGIAEDVEGNKYYVVKGVVKKEYTGTVSYKGKTYKVVKGVVK